ncbi:exported hypothetical protein [Paraburkholderia ribeironis]|uniref:Uncharacterized protein n=1 Tax=Paraburkholderia ribeironis TaxID=1247936 RepID=A0A1N7S728_9BURK|nr:exported hypothetical protein [Paraburkholderia ribeironis]
MLSLTTPMMGALGNVSAALAGGFAELKNPAFLPVELEAFAWHQLHCGWINSVID